MKRLSITLTLAALFAAVSSLPLAAQDGPPPGMATRMRPRAGGLLRCLRGLDLSDSQRADIKAILDAAKPTVQGDTAAIRAAHQKLDADYAAGADKSVIGQDYLDLRAAVKKLHDDGAATRDLVLGKLTADQKTAAQACLDAHAGPRRMFQRSGE